MNELNIVNELIVRRADILVESILIRLESASKSEERIPDDEMIDLLSLIAKHESKNQLSEQLFLCIRQSETIHQDDIVDILQTIVFLLRDQVREVQGEIDEWSGGQKFANPIAAVGGSLAVGSYIASIVNSVTVPLGAASLLGLLLFISSFSLSIYFEIQKRKCRGIRDRFVGVLEQAEHNNTVARSGEVS